MTPLSQRHFLKTGVTSDIGEAIALQLLKAGSHVVGVARNEKKLATLQTAFPGQFKAVVADISDKEAWQTIAAQAPDELDCVILNAGTCEYIDEGKVDSDLVHRVFATNFFANVYASEFLLPKLTQLQQWVLVSSSASFIAFPRAEAYGASKAALNYFFESLQLAYPNVAFNFVYPGFVQTPLTDKNDFEMPNRVTAEFAAEQIIKGIQDNKRSISFPKAFTLFLRLIGKLPAGIRYRFGKKLLKEQ